MNQFITKDKEKTIEDKSKLQVALSCIILLCIWQVVALKINNDIYLPTLGQVLISIKEIVFTDRFLIDVVATLSRCIIRKLLSYLHAQFQGFQLQSLKQLH